MIPKNRARLPSSADGRFALLYAYGWPETMPVQQRRLIAQIRSAIPSIAMALWLIDGTVRIPL